MATAADIIAAWRGDGATALPWDDIERALAHVPEPEAWALGDDGSALFALGPGATLFAVITSGPAVRVTSRPLAADRLMISLEWEGSTTHWTFRYLDQPEPGEPWQTITGRADTPDARERFARAIAERAGWDFSEQQPRQPAADETEVPRWRRQTDLWGQPLKSS